MRYRSFLMMSCVGLLLTACASNPVTVNRPMDAGDATDINGGYVNGSMSLPDTKLPSLGEIRSIHKMKGGFNKNTAKEKARLNQLRDSALAYGAQLGLYRGTKEINDRLNRHAAELSDIYNFTPFLIHDKSGQTMLPPVITEQDEIYQSTDNGRTLDIADKKYTIEKNVQWVPTSPLWHGYLFRSFEKPQLPENNQLPGNEEEQAVWARYVTEGYDRGLHQSVDIFKQDMRVLQHDFGGMVRYYTLLENHQITNAPFTAENHLGITGNDNEAVYNHRVMKIMDLPRLVVDNPDRIRSSASSATPGEAITEPGSSDGQGQN